MRRSETDPEAPQVPEGFWADLGDLAVQVGWKAVTVVIIIIGALIVSWVLRRVIHRIVDRVVNSAKDKANVDDTQALERSPLAQVRLVQRTRTLGTILQNIVNVSIVIIAVMLTIVTINQELLGSLTILSAAIGAGLGIGAQNLVKDIVNGIFIVAEDQIGIGDVVDLGLATGMVEYVSVRVTHVRDVNGTLWYVRNGEVTRIGNLSQGWSRIVIDVTVPRDTEIDRVEDAMLLAASSMVEEPKWRTRIVERPEVWGLESLEGEVLVLRLVMKTRPHAKDDVSAELRVRLRQVLLDQGIDLTGLQAVIPEGIGAAQRVRGADVPQTRPNPLPSNRKPARAFWRPKKRGVAADEQTDPSAPGAQTSHTDEDGEIL